MSQGNGPIKGEVVRLMAGHTGYFNGMATTTNQAPSAAQASNVFPANQAFAGQALFDNLPYETLTFQEGATIFKENEKSKGLYVLKTGCVKMYVNRDNTRGRTTTPEYVTKLVSPGELFGYKSVISQTQTMAYAKAVRTSTVWLYDLDSMMQLLGSVNPLIRNLLDQAVLDLMNYEKTSQLHYLASVQERIAYQLIVLSDKFGIKTDRGTSLNLKLTRNEFAQLASTINESLSRHLTEFKNEGLIDINGKEIMILNREGLAAKSRSF